MILDDFKPLADGPRSTFIELDMQLFFVTFELHSTTISAVRIFVPLLEEFKAENIAGIKLTEVGDKQLIKAFIDLYTAKAVKRRMM